MKNDVDVIKNIAKEAGEIILKYYYSDFTLEYKDDNSPVTIADKEANDLIVRRLKECFPHYAILSEESIDDKSRLNKSHCFIIDPLDGTKDFINRIEEFTINIALAINQKIVFSVVYSPVRDELFFAKKDEGAFREFKGKIERIRVSDRTKDLRVVRSRFHFCKKTEELLMRNKDKIKEIIPYGSALKGCLIAKGDFDVYYRFTPINEWDIAAVHCIVEEAGGIVRDMDDGELLYNKEDVCFHKGIYILNRTENRFK